MFELTRSALDDISQLVHALMLAEADVIAAEEELKRRKELARALREEDLPGVLSEHGVTSLKMDDGTAITVSNEVYASIPAARKEEAFGWLEEHGFGGLIKTGVSVSLGRESIAEAAALAEDLAKRGYEPAIERDVHPQTLRAFLKEQLAAATDVPLELFGARPVTVAKVKAPKK